MQMVFSKVHPACHSIVNGITPAYMSIIIKNKQGTKTMYGIRALNINDDKPTTQQNWNKINFFFHEND